ncbi:MAG: hypothetical protein LJE69_16705 [Thiohalocapsa sp.]|uniref:hypothetical protein n=1 Tax=Thiohalocapsa sp. TaxID=2497641 RepID=UPI0025D282F0|nr:hypothetical protein [Thiohalocapsa sp.]MCG6942878.1 hypothetical protein [Thiohalocapsa sp.]
MPDAALEPVPRRAVDARPADAVPGRPDPVRRLESIPATLSPTVGADTSADTDFDAGTDNRADAAALPGYLTGEPAQRQTPGGVGTQTPTSVPGANADQGPSAGRAPTRATAERAGSSGGNGREPAATRGDAARGDADRRQGDAQGQAGDRSQGSAQRSDQPRAQAATNDGAGGGGPAPDQGTAPATDRATDQAPADEPLPEVPITVLGIDLPEVPAPPAAARERAEQIRTRTGMPPSLHHAQVRAAMAALVESARAGQRMIVFETEHLARQTGFELMLLTGPVAAAMARGIARVEHGIQQAIDAVDQVADAARAHLDTQEQNLGQKGKKKREEVVAEVHDGLVGNDAAMRQAYDELKTRFASSYLDKAKERVGQILETGKATPLALPQFPAPEGSAAAKGEQAPAPRCAKSNATRTMSQAKAALVKYVKAQDEGAIGRWVEKRTLPVLERDHKVELAQRRTELKRRAGALNLYAGLFLSAALGITTPVGSRYRKLMEARPEEARRAFATDAERRAADFARYRRQLEDKRNGVKDYLRHDLKPRLIKGLRKAGRKAIAGLRRQARTVERSLAATAPELAAAYPELVQRAAALLPPGQFLDARRLTPLLDKARESAAALPEQQLPMLRERAGAMHARMAAGAADTAAKLDEQAGKALRGIDDLKQGVAVDMNLFVSQSTGVVTAAMGATLSHAHDYAKRRITALLATKDDPEGQLARTMAAYAGSMNQDLACACSAYLDAVEAYRVRMQDQTLRQVIKTTRGDLNDRAHRADDAMPVRSLGTAGMVALTVVSPVGGLIYATSTRAKPDTVFDAVGGLPWPGPGAVEATFNDQNPDTLRHRIREVLDADDARTVRGLLSGNALSRKRARDQVVDDSLGIFSGDAWFGNSRQTRENVLRAQAFELMADPAAAAQVGPAERARTRAILREKLSGPELTISTSYLDLNPAGALAARIEERRVQARDRQDAELFSLAADVEQMTRQEFALSPTGAALTNDEIQAHFDAAIIEFARQRSGAGDQAPKLKDARETFIHAMTANRDRTAAEQAFADPTAGLGEHNRGEAVGRETTRYVRDLTRHGLFSDQAWASKAAYEMHHAEGESFGPSEDSQHRVTLALEDLTLARLRRDLDERRAYYQSHPAEHQAALNALHRAERERAARLRLLASRLAADDAARNTSAGNADSAANTAAKRVAGMSDEQVQASVSTRTQRLFSGVEDVSRLRTGTTGADDLTDAEKRARYGRELVEGGRASVVSTTYLATADAGTNETLLKHGLTGRSAREMASARGQWRSEEGTSFDNFLGLGDQGGLGSEVSGDLAFELTELARGDPVTDRGHMEAALRHERFQRVSGTGGLGSMAMDGTPEQAYMARQRGALAQQIIAAARANAPPGTEIPNDPSAVLGPDGRIAEPYATYAFGPGPNDATLPPEQQGGHFRGDRISMLRSMDHLEGAARNYQAELDRQESILTGAITALAVAISVALMLIPGVNLVAAGVITALVAGAATMAVKAGMRGDRYGWEEAATDAAQTAIEATMAGVGGALGGGLGDDAATLAGKLAGVGSKLNSTFGRVGGAVVREGLTGAMGSVAQTAIQDDTWHKGAGNGLMELLKAGGRGAAVGAVSAGVSEGLDARLTRSLARGADPEDFSRMARLSRRLGPKAGGMLREGVGGALGSMAGETAGVLFDVGTGKHKGTFDDALMQIGQAGLKDLWSGAARNRVMQRNRSRYRRMLADAVRSGSPSPAQLRALRLAGISAGEVFPRQGLDAVATQVQAARDSAAVLPPDLRRVALEQGMSAETIQALLRRLHGDTGPDAPDRRQLIADLIEKHPGMDVAGFMADLDVHVARRERARRLSNVPPDLRDTLSALPDHALVLLRVAQAQQRDLSPAERTRMLDDALREAPGLDRHALDTALDAALDAALVRTRGEPVQTAAEQASLRAALLDSVPDAQRHLVADTPVILMRADEFEAMTRSTSGQAVTLIIDGRPVVVLREGADPAVLGEEGLHVLQARDPAWAKHIGSLDEVSLSDWQRMPLAERAARYGNKLDLEIDAQQRRIADLEQRVGAADDPALRARLADQLELTRRALANLNRRAGEVGSLTPETLQAMDAGILTRPGWLEQPARLFNKAEEPRAGGLRARLADLAQGLAERLGTHGGTAEQVQRLLAEAERLAGLSTGAGALASRLKGEIGPLLALLHTSLRGTAGADAGLRERIVNLGDALLDRYLRPDLGDLALDLGDLDLAPRFALPEPALQPAQVSDRAAALRAFIAAHPELDAPARQRLDGAITDAMADGLHRLGTRLEGPAFLALLRRFAASYETSPHLRQKAAEALGEIADLAPGGYGMRELGRLLEQLPADGPQRLMYREVEQLRTVLQRGAPWTAPALEGLTARLRPLTTQQRRDLLRGLAQHPRLVATLRIELEQEAMLRIAGRAAALARDETAVAAAFADDVATAVEQYGPDNARRLLEGLARMGANETMARVARGLVQIPVLVPKHLPDAPELRRRLLLAVIQGGRSDLSAALLPQVLPRLAADGQRRLASLLGEVGAGSRPLLLTTVRDLQDTVAALHLPPARRHELLAGLLESAHTPRDRMDFLANAARLLQAAQADTPARLSELVDYLLTGRGNAEQQAWLGSDLVKAVNRLDDGIGIGKLLDQLANDPPALAGGDPWVLQLRQAREDWQALPDPPPLFAALVADATASRTGWNDGHRGTLLEQSAWLAKQLQLELQPTLPFTPTRAQARQMLADLRAALDAGADGDLTVTVDGHTLTVSRAELLAKLGAVLDAAPVPTSSDRSGRVGRAFREAVADADTELQGPAPLKDLLERVGADPDPANNPAVLKQHLEALYEQERKYQRLVHFAEEMGVDTAGLNQQVTEVVGEFALTKYMLAETDAELIGPFAKGTGFDQVWRASDGTLIIGEAKGPGAKLGNPNKGPQMSDQWVLATLLEMIRTGGSRAVSIDGAADRPLAEILLEAALGGEPRIRGVVIEAQDARTYDWKAPTPNSDTGWNGYDLRNLDLWDHPHIQALLRNPDVVTKLDEVLSTLPDTDENKELIEQIHAAITAAQGG